MLPKYFVICLKIIYVKYVVMIKVTKGVLAVARLLTTWV